MKTLIIAAFALVSNFSSCITSFRPLVTDDKIITDDRVIGSWKGPDGMLEIAMLKDSKIYKGWSATLAEGLQQKETSDPQQPEPANDMERKMYAVSYNRGEDEYHLVARMMRINGDIYMDIGPLVSGDPKKDKSSGFEFNVNYLPACTIAKVEITDNNHIDIRFADGDYIKKQLLAGNIRLPYEYDPLFGSFVVTASSETLQQFIAKYGNDERLFGKHNSITLSRKG